MEDKNVSGAAIPRREALRLVAAATGAATLSALPNGWEKPQVAVGAVPAKAQDASGLFIDQASLVLTADENDGSGHDNANLLTYIVRIEFDYVNAVGGVALMDVKFDWENAAGTDGGSGPTPSPTVHVQVPDPDGTDGHIDHTVAGVIAGGESADVSIFIRDGSGQTSNTVTGSVTFPPI